MLKNPFDSSTVTVDPSAMGAGVSATPFHGVEVRYPAASRVLVPAALASSGVIVPLICFFALPKPFNITMAVVTAVVELSTAAFMWFLFNAAFVRADEAGITRKQLGQQQSARWDEISTMEQSQSGNGPTQLKFKNAFGNEVFSCTTLGNRADGARLINFVQKKLDRSGQ